MIHYNPNILLRIAQADTYAAATEYIKFPRDIDVYKKALEFNCYGEHPSHNSGRYKYTDDTQMSIAVSEVLLNEHHSKRAFVESFVDCFKRDERNGYSRMFQALLEKISSVDEFIEIINPASDKNGAAMRSVPLGVLPDIKYMLQVAKLQASITHNTFGGIFSSQAVALMSHFSLYETAPLKKELYDYCVSYLPEFEIFSEPWVGPVTGPNVGMRTAHAVFHLLNTQNSLMDILKETIHIGGDTDSVAAIAWGIASGRMQNEDLPLFLEKQLEPEGNYGVLFLKDLGKKLMDKYK